MITFEDFKKVEIRAGKIISAEKIQETDKLLKLMVDFGEVEEITIIADSNLTTDSNPAAVSKIVKPKLRQIVSGIALRFPDPAVLVGKTCMFVANLEPRTIKGVESNGMLFAVSTPEGGFSLLEPNGTIPPGAIAI
jgi:tRNA-binding EMAP/Myf-like protein